MIRVTNNGDDAMQAVASRRGGGRRGQYARARDKFDFVDRKYV